MEIEITISDPQLKLEHMTTRVKFVFFKNIVVISLIIVIIVPDYHISDNNLL